MTWVLLCCLWRSGFYLGVFCVEVAPDGGVKSICIRGVEGNSEGFLVINRCPVIQRVMVHTYHTEMSVQGQSTDIGGGPSSFPPSSSNWSRHPLKLPDFDFHFFANEGETVAYGWPFPFTYTSRPVRSLRTWNGALLPQFPVACLSLRCIPRAFFACACTPYYVIYALYGSDLFTPVVTQTVRTPASRRIGCCFVDRTVWFE